MKKILVLLLCTALLMTMVSWEGESGGGSPISSAAADTGKTRIMTIGTADSTGTMYPVGAAVASVINDNIAGVKVNVETSKGSPANCVNIQSGEVQLATIAGDTARQAVLGEGKFEGNACKDLRAICAVYTSLSNWIALESSGLTMVNQLTGKNVAVGPEASTTEIAALVALEACAVTPGEKVNLGLGDGANEVGDGVRDAAHGFAGIPIGGQLSVAQTKDCVFLGYTDEELDKVVAINPSYYKTVIPAGTYPNQDKDVPTFGVKCLIVVNANMDDETAYKIAEAIATHVPDLVAGHASMKSMEDPDFICNNLPIELHPGALKYYTDAGMIK